MSYQSDDGKHDGWAAAVFPDGRVQVGSQGTGVFVRPIGPSGFDDDVSEAILEGRTAVGWRGVCTCGWQGELWERVATRAEHDLQARRIYDREDQTVIDGKPVDLWVYGDAPPAVEDAIHQEWKDHLEPATVAAVRQAAEAVREAQARLDAAVYAARTDGQSWTQIGEAAGMARQSAHERWGGRHRSVLDAPS